MRPVRLELEGFGTFRERTVVDLDDLDLVAIVGPTGSGKSTLIDAVTFSLYGSVARYDNTSLVAPVIHQLANEARVRFDFELAGRRYRAVRVVRRMRSTRDGAQRASTREARLELDEGEAGTTVLAGNVSELDDEVQRLIGLDFRQFTRTIVLPQGAFAEFLTDDPGNRQKLLRRLLDVDIYSRMGARARERASQAGHQLEVYRHELSRLDHVTPAALVDAEAEGAALDEFAATVEERLGHLADLDTELDGFRARVIELDRLLGGLATIAVPEEVTRGAAVLDEAAERVERTSAALDAARTARDQADEAVLAAGDPVGLQDQRRSRERLVELDAAIGSLAAELAGAVTLSEEAAVAATGADATAERTDAELRALRQAADADHWVARLEVGADCPVCGQEVVALPVRVGADALRPAEVAAEAARVEARRCANEAARADGRVRSLEADRDQLAKQRELLASQLEGVADLATLEAAADRAALATRRAREAVITVRNAEAAAETATKDLEAARSVETRFRPALTTQRDAVAELDPPRPQGESLADDWAELATWARTTSTDLAAERATSAERGKALAAGKAALLDELAARAGVLGITAPANELIPAVAAARASVEARVSRIRDDLAHKSELADTVNALAARQSVDETLGRQHLSANGFERWLLAEALDDIVERATARLFELSSGRYSLEAVDGSFSVRDHGNADERRDVRTLSGGEVFLASLSLALALADSIADLAPVDAPRLESIFLDEGFGTLDAETLDVLASAIEELSATGRLVVIVTHVRDLADRMPVRFEVRREPGTSKVEKVTT